LLIVIAYRKRKALFVAARVVNCLKYFDLLFFLLFPLHLDLQFPKTY